MSLQVSIAHQFEGTTLDVRFDAPVGVTALFGPSGSGKTTVVRAVAGLLRPDRCKIVLDGDVLQDTEQDVFQPVHRRKLGLVFQDARLFPHLNVRQNLLYGTRFSGGGSSADDLESITKLLGITNLLERKTWNLSGGEKQRVAIGRALLSKPRMLLMDEPLAALDASRKQEILPYLERLRDEVGVPILYVSHAVSEIARIATSVVVMDNGRVTKSGPADTMLSDPDLVRIFGLRETGALLNACVKEHHSDGLTELHTKAGSLFLPQLDTPVGASTRVRILAHDVILAGTRPRDLSALNILDAEVAAIREGQGPGMIVQLVCGDDRLLARVTQRSAQAMDLRPGKKVHAVIKSVAVARTDIGTG